MINYFKAEWRKTKKAQIILIGILFIALSSFIGLGNYFLNRQILIDGTQSEIMWGQLTFYYSQILFPPMIGIMVAISLMPEFDRKTIEMLRANNVSIRNMLFGKLLSMIILLIPLQLSLLVIFFCSMKVDNISVMGEILVHLKWVLVSIIGAIPLICIQLFITAKSNSFSQSVGISAIGAIGGFVLLFLNESLNKLYPFSFTMIALRSRILIDFTSIELICFIGISVLYSIFFFRICEKSLLKK